jgi:hypothetical protein
MHYSVAESVTKQKHFATVETGFIGCCRPVFRGQKMLAQFTFVHKTSPAYAVTVMQFKAAYIMISLVLG